MRLFLLEPRRALSKKSVPLGCKMNCSKDAVLDALTDFANQKPAEIPSVLDEYLAHIAKTGDTLFSWQKLRPLLCRKLELVMNEFHKASPTDDLPALPNVEVFKFEEMRDKVLEAVNSFSSAPFTIQRLCELVVDPRKHYKRTDKFMRGVEKNVLVVSTVEPKSLASSQQANASATPMVNGIPGAEDGAINGHLADTTEEPLGRLDGENGHCEDEGICADDPGNSVDVPAAATITTAEATTSSASSGDAPQPVPEEVVEEQETKAVAGCAEQTKAESSPSGESGEAKEVANGEAKEESSGEAGEEASEEASGEASEEAATEKEEQEVQVEKEALQELPETAAPSVETPAAESTTESPSAASVEGESTAAPTEPEEGALSKEKEVVEAAVSDKDAPEAAAEVPSEADSEDTAGAEAEPEVATGDSNEDDEAEKQPSQSAPDLSEADAVPPPAESKPVDPPVTCEEAASDFNRCDSSISAEVPCTDDDDEDLKEPPLKKFHAEPKEEVRAEEEPAAEEQEQPSSTSVFVEENLAEKEATSRESAEASKSEDVPPKAAEDPVEAMDTAVDSSADKDVTVEDQAAVVDEPAMEN